MKHAGTALCNVIILAVVINLKVQILQANSLPPYFLSKELQNNQIFASTLNQFHDRTDVLHFYSHGKPGMLLINGKWKNPKEIASFIKSNYSLFKLRHINIYGCEFGKGVKGRSALKSLRSDLNVTISASDDITGVDGDWILEIGEKTETIPINNYSGNLQTYNMGDYDQEVITTCSGVFVDNGGASDYSNDQSLQVIFCSNNNSSITLNFTDFDIEDDSDCSYDYLRIYDLAASSTAYTEYCGTTGPGSISSTGSCLLVTFDSDESVVAPGWSANISCESNSLSDNCCFDHNVVPDGSFEGSFTPDVEFPNYTINPASKSILIGSDEVWLDWYGVADDFFSFYVISDNSKASDGDNFVYIRYDGSSTNNYCITENQYFLGDPFATCGSEGYEKSLVAGQRYIACFDWAPFAQSSPNGTSNTAVPKFEMATYGSTNNFFEIDLYDSQGNIAGPKSGVAWQNVGSSWEKVCAYFTTDINDFKYSLYYSHDVLDNCGILIDKCSVQEIGFDDSGLNSPLFGGSPDEALFDLNPNANTEGIPGLKYNVSVPSDFSIDPSQGTYGEVTTFTVTSLVDGNFLDGSPSSFEITITDEQNTECFLNEVVSLPALLPVELDGFKAETKNSTVQLNWNTISETQNSHFEIERSKDGINFSKIGMVEGYGNSYVEREYGFVDYYPIEMNYYRLKQVDLEGRFEYSHIEAVRFLSGNKIKIYPNPAREVLSIDVNESLEYIYLEIYDSNGAIVLKTKAKNISQTNIGNLKNGVYLINIKDQMGNSIKVEKLVKY